MLTEIIKINQVLQGEWHFILLFCSIAARNKHLEGITSNATPNFDH